MNEKSVPILISLPDPISPPRVSEDMSALPPGNSGSPPQNRRNGPEPKRERARPPLLANGGGASAACRQRCSNDETPLHEEVQKHGFFPAAIGRLQRVDWDFTDAITSHLTHRLHPYPAKYIPQIPHELIRQLSGVGETVGDIFCGSGTTMVEAMLLKRNAVGVDANPLACLISEAKTTRFSQGDKECLIGLAQNALRLSRTIRRDEHPSTSAPAQFVSAAPRPAHKSVNYWFEPFVIEELAEVLQWCRQLPTPAGRNVALTSFSAIVVNVSKQDSDTRYVRRQKNLKPGDVLLRFAKVLAENTIAVEQFSNAVDAGVTCQVIHTDMLNSPRTPKLDLVVCSPPYPNAYSYHLYHATRMIWLGMDQPDFRRREIGSHRKYSRKGSSGATIETFRSEMVKVFSWLKQSLRDGGHACFVIGNSTIKGERHDNAEVLQHAASSSQFMEVACLSRRLKAANKSFNPEFGSIKTEKILVFQNVKAF